MPAAATERTLRAILQYGIDPRGLREVKSGTGELEDALDALKASLAESGEATDELEGMFESLGDTLSSMSSADAPVLKAALDEIWTGFKDGKLSIQQVDAALGELESSFRAVTVFEDLQEDLGRLRQQAQLVGEEWQDLGAVVSQFEAIGSEFAGVGMQITDTIKGWADQYVQVAGEADEVSKLWLETTKELETAQARLGGVAIKALVPLIEATASAVDKAADLAEKYPEAMQIALGIGTAIVAAAALTSAVTRGIRLFADAKLLVIETQRVLAARMMQDAANKQLAAAAGMQAGAKGGAAAGGVRGLVGAAGGGLAAAAPALAIGAAVVAVGAAGVAVKRFADNVGEKTGEMGNHWDVFLTRSVGEVENAADLASQYNDAQRGINQRYEEAGALAATFLSRQGLVNANQAKVQQALVQVAKDHGDYERAITSLNSELGEGEKAFKLLDKAAFDQRKEMDKLWQSYREGNATLRDIASASSGFQALVLRLQAGVQEATAGAKLIEPWQVFLDEVEAASKTWAADTIAINKEHDDALVALADETGAAREQIASEWDRAILMMDLQTATEREAILERQNTAMVATEKDTGADRLAAMSSFQSDLAQAEAEHYASRSELAADHGQDVQRAEADHQKAMRRMQEDSENRQRSAIRSRDALGLLEEVRSNRTERSRAEEDHRIEMARSSEDFARQLAQMEIAFQEQQTARQRAFEEELAAIQTQQDDEKRIRDEAAAQELEALEENRTRELRDLHDQKEAEEKALGDSFTRQEQDLNKTLQTQQAQARTAFIQSEQDAQNRWNRERQMRGVFLTGELSELNAHYQQRLTSLQAWMAQAQLVVRPPSGGGFPERQAGGYSEGAGLHMLGERGREFVMNAQTTRRAETMSGGALSQAGLLAAMSGAGGAQVQVTQTNHFGNVSDPAQIGAMIEQRTLAVIEKVLRDVR